MCKRTVKKTGVSFNQNGVNTKDMGAMPHRIITYFAFAFKTDDGRIWY